MDELSKKKEPEPDDDQLIAAGFCPHCLCPDSSVLTTRKVSYSKTRIRGDERERIPMLKIIRYRKCDHCGRNFRTQEKSVG